MKTYRQLAMGLLALMICIALPSCSDDDDNGSQTNELTLNWEIEVSDDLLDVAEITCTSYEGKEETPEPQELMGNYTSCDVKGKAPSTLGAYFTLYPKKSPTRRRRATTSASRSRFR